MDHIFIRDLRIEARIGFHKRERLVDQTLRIDLEIGIGNAAVFTSDKVADCIDYDTVATGVRELARREHLNLVETLAERIATFVLADFAASWVRVSVAKLGVLKDAGLVGVTLERRRA